MFILRRRARVGAVSHHLDSARRVARPGQVVRRALLGLVLAGPVLADVPRIIPLPDHSARRILSQSEQTSYGAVGQVQNGAQGRHCTGTLIAPDLVLTAAHCVSNRKDGWVARPYRVVFSPNYRVGQRAEKRNGAAMSIGAGYLVTGEIGDDLALLRLKDPIPAEVITPIPVADETILRGRLLSVLSYGYDAPHAMARETDCRSLASYSRAMVTSCEAVGGVSGSPVIALDDTGHPRVTAVVSSRLSRTSGNTRYGRAVVVPMNGDRLAKLQAALSSAPGG